MLNLSYRLSKLFELSALVYTVLCEKYAMFVGNLEFNSHNTNCQLITSRNYNNIKEPENLKGFTQYK